MKEETLSFLGLLRKGGNLIIGKAVEGALKKSALIIVAADAGEAVKKSIVDKASYYQINYHIHHNEYDYIQC